jgi:Peptidase M10 serralysin C terminal
VKLSVAGSGETNFVGGAGHQVLIGGKGANILTYLAVNDGGDQIGAFDPAKDVIDLSHIDADIIQAGLQNFTFIGSAPFDGKGGEVRYQLNPSATDPTTTVQAVLAGDITADFTITIGGLVPLTAANFALTPAQSTAALANGAALTYATVRTPAGAPTDIAYSNVAGRAYTSYDAFSNALGLLGENLNLSSATNELMLYGPNQTVTRGGGAESLQAGTGSDPLSYHAVETIDATTSPSEQFVFSAGFGNETINGLAGAGANSDIIRLASSAFSYLTPGFTQAEDLAAVLSQSSRNSSGLTIPDSHGDTLTLTGVTPAMIAANPAMLEFT